MVPMFFAARWVIRTSLAPLGAAAAQMDSVVGTDRGFRVNLGDFPLETQPFARALNDLLARLDEVAEQRETFAANVAHELRTPLAILMIELDRLGSRSGEGRVGKECVSTCRYRGSRSHKKQKQSKT